MELVLLFSIILLSHVAIVPTDGHRTDFCADRNDSIVADPEDCSAFYRCFSQLTYHFMCAPNLFYDEKHSTCSWPYLVACGQRSIPSSAPTTINQDRELNLQASTTSSSLMTHSTPESIIKETSTQTPNSPHLAFCQTKADNLYSDPEDCHSFYQCRNGFSYHFKCPFNLIFNSKMSICDWPFNVNCIIPVNNPDGSHETQTGSTSAVITHQAENCGKVICYFPNWAIYRRGLGARFGPENVNPGLCTHLIYAFATLLDNRLVASDSADEARGTDIGNFARATQLKNQNPKLKVLLAIGGWKMDPYRLYNMASSEKTRAEFITTAIQFLRQRNFDGLSLDWNNAGDIVRPDVYKELYTKLCEELRSAFDNEASGDERLLLTSAVSGIKAVIDTMYDIPRLAAALDIINVMSYDLHGTWDGRTGHGSPLKAGSWEGTEELSLNLEWVANYWASNGTPKNKITIGVPLYARTFTLSSTSNTEVGAPITGPGLPGKYTSEYGYLSYYEVCLMMNYSSKYFIESQRVPYLVSGNQWVSYENVASLQEKTQYITTNGFGGLMIWDISQDDSSGKFCANGLYPLMNAILSQCAASGITPSPTP